MGGKAVGVEVVGVGDGLWKKVKRWGVRWWRAGLETSKELPGKLGIQRKRWKVLTDPGEL